MRKAISLILHRRYTISPPISVPWTPPAIAPSIWYKGDDTASQTYSSGSVVASLADLSGNSINFANAFGSPTYTPNIQNGLGIIRFNGTSDALSCRAGSFANGSFMAFAVIAARSANTGASISFNEYGNGGNYGFIESNRSDFSNKAYFGANDSIIGSNISGFNIFAFGNQLGSMYFSINGNTPQTLTSTPFVNLDSIGLGVLVRSANANGILFSPLDFLELFSVSGTVNSTNIDKAVGYLAWRCGLVANLPSGHPYKSIQPYV